MAVSGDGPKAAHLWGAVPDVLHWSVASFVDGRSLCAMAACLVFLVAIILPLIVIHMKFFFGSPVK